MYSKTINETIALLRKWCLGLCLWLCVGSLMAQTVDSVKQTTKAEQTVPVELKVMPIDTMPRLAVQPPQIPLSLWKDLAKPSLPILNSTFDPRQIRQLPPEVRTLAPKGISTMPITNMTVFAHQQKAMSLYNSLDEKATIGVHIPINYGIGAEASASIGHSYTPLNPHLHNNYELYGGLTYTNADQSTSIRAGMAYGQYIGTKYINPNASGSFMLSNRLTMTLNAGGYFAQNPIVPYGMENNTLYAGMRMDYMVYNNFYIFGQGNLYSTQMYGPNRFNGWGMLSGGGYKIKGAGHIELGMRADYNPFTGRMEFRPHVDLSGAVIYLIQQMIEKIKE